MDKTIIELLEKLLNQKELTNSEELLISELKKNNEFEEKKELMEDFLAAMDVFGSQQLKNDMETWRFEMEVEEMKGQAAPSDSGSSFDAIPEAALIAHFAESPSYSTAIRASNRNTGISIEYPQNGFHWNQQTINFKIKGLNNDELKFQIEDNLHDLILNGPLVLSDNQFSLDFDWENTRPGRYYLKIFNEKGMDLIDFFVHQDLMPDLNEKD